MLPLIIVWTPRATTNLYDPQIEFIEFEQLVERALYKKRHQNFRDARETLEAQYYLAWMTHISSGKFGFQSRLKRARSTSVYC